jgi:hypothetical protein
MLIYPRRFLPFLSSSNPPTKIKALNPSIIKGCATKFFVNNPNPANNKTTIPNAILIFFNKVIPPVPIVQYCTRSTIRKSCHVTAFWKVSYSSNLRYWPPKYNNGSPSFTFRSVTSPINKMWSPASTSL